MAKLRQKSNTQEELLQNTINHFNINNRSVVDGSCEYRDDKGNACAIGREIPDKLAYSKNGKNFSVLKFFDELPKRLKNMNGNFLCRIQSLHDREVNWNEKGLTTTGKCFVEEIIINFKLDSSKITLS
jgi:hypothetical protein